MTNPNIGKKVNISGINKAAEKIKAQAIQAADKAVLPHGPNAPEPPVKKTATAQKTKPHKPAPETRAPQTPARTKAELTNRTKNVKQKIIYFEHDVYDELQKMKQSGRSASHYVNGLVKQNLGL